LPYPPPLVARQKQTRPLAGPGLLSFSPSPFARPRPCFGFLPPACYARAGSVFFPLSLRTAEAVLRVSPPSVLRTRGECLFPPLPSHGRGRASGFSPASV